MALGFWQTLNTLQAPGGAITAAARTSMTVSSTQGRFTLPANALKTLGDQIQVNAYGIISCVVTTPGTANFDFAMDTVAKMVSGAMPLNVVARTNVLWNLNMMGTLTTIGTAAVLTWAGSWESEAYVGTSIQNVGGDGGTMLPYNGTVTGASTASVSFDSTVSHLLDLYFTQTAATGSCTLQQMNISLLTATGF